jgi:type IV pilus assembly protein PilQ
VVVEPGTSADGAGLARVRMMLVKPATPSVRSRLNTVIVEFAAEPEPAADAAAAAAPPEAPATDAPAAVAAAPAPAELNPPAPAGLNPPAPADVTPPAPRPGQAPAPFARASTAVAAPSPGASLTSVETTTFPGGTRIAFSGTGTFSAGTIEPARDMPPRLVIDFPRLRSTLPAVTPVGKGPVDRIRVAVNRVNPLVTRAVIDLKYPAAHRVESTENGVVIVFDEPAASETAAVESREPAPAAAAAPRTRVPETATEPRPESRPAARPTPVIVAPPAPPAPEFVPVPDAAPVKSEAAPAPKAEAPAPKADAPAPKAAAPAPRQVNPSRPAPSAAGDQKQYSGHLITFDFYQADLRSVLRTFSEISGLNIVIDPTVPSGTVDVSLREVPWDQALEVILRSHQLGYVLEQNVVRIAPLKSLAQEENERQKLVEAQAMGGQLKVFTKTLSYARAGEVAKLLKDARVLSSRGSALVDDRTNTLILNDLPEAIGECENLIGILDRAEAQVEIEAKIVQTSSDTARALGVQWGLNGRMATELGNTAPVAFPAQSAVSGRTNNVQGNPMGPERAATPSAVNLPAPGATSALGLSMGTLTGSFNLDVALTALERKGQGKILSQPKVMMQNNFEAEMTQGVQIPIQTVSNNTVTVTFKDATLTLKVKPQITASSTVMMNITLENAAPDYSRSVNGIPPIDTQRAITQVLVNDTETMVIGGIMKSQETSAKDGVPGLSRIPLLGWLFRRDLYSDELRELLIFITPRIRR